MIDIESVLHETLNQSILDELMLEKSAPINQEVLAEAIEKSKGNPWDASILYDLILLKRNLWYDVFIDFKEMNMDRSFVLRNKNLEFFAGFKHDATSKFLVKPVFVKAGKGNAVQVMLINQDDLDETKNDLKRAGVDINELDQVQVG